jgi:cell division inhibitor SepF
MDDLQTLERPGLFTRLAGLWNRNQEIEEGWDEPVPGFAPRSQTYRYQVTIRRQIVSFQDAVAAADGLKRGEQQILNLTMADPSLRDKIKDFMCGVNYAQEGSWEEIGEDIFLLAPAFALVDVAPASPRMTASRN